MPGLVPPEQLAASQALQSIYSNTGAIVGPALGGLLIAAAGVGTTYVIDTVSFVASLAAVFLISPAPPQGDVEAETLESLRQGRRFLVRQKVILGTFVLDTNAMVFGMPQALFPAVAAAHFDAGAGVVGLLYAAPAVGALVAALGSGWIAHVRRQGVAVAAAIVLWGLAIVGFGLATALWLGLAMLALAGLADEYSAILRSTILFAGTPDRDARTDEGFELAQVASTPAIGNLEAGRRRVARPPSASRSSPAARLRSRRSRDPRGNPESLPLRREEPDPRNGCLTRSRRTSSRAASTRSRPT